MNVDFSLKHTEEEYISYFFFFFYCSLTRCTSAHHPERRQGKHCCARRARLACKMQSWSSIFCEAFKAFKSDAKSLHLHPSNKANWRMSIIAVSKKDIRQSSLSYIYSSVGSNRKLNKKQYFPSQYMFYCFILSQIKPLTNQCTSCFISNCT